MEKLQKTVPFDEKVHLIDGNQTITYVECDCGITFFPLARTKVNLIKRERNILPDPVKTQSSSRVRINKTVLLMKSITLSFFWIPAVYGTWIQQLVFHSPTLLTEILCAFSILKHQLINIKEIFMSSILFPRTDRKGLRVTFAFFRRSLLRDERVNDLAATVDVLSDCRNLGAFDGIFPFALTCNCIQM